MDNNYIKQLKVFISTTGKLDNSSGPFGKIYSMTTENIYGFLNNLDLKDKDILTISGSGDQRLNAYLLGAKNVTTFDINPLTRINAKLKDTAIQNLSLDEFIDFFGINSNTHYNRYLPLDKDLFGKLNRDLDEDTSDFFKFIIDNQTQISTNDIYFHFDNKLSVLEKMNGYLNENSYLELRHIIENKEINYIESDINQLKTKLDNKKYDLILLSNISDYINRMYDEPLKDYRNLIDSLTDYLKPNGIIQVGYIYYHKHRNISSFTNDRKRQMYFPTNSFHTIMVDAFDIPKEKDKVIIYQK